MASGGSSNYNGEGEGPEVQILSDIVVPQKFYNRIRTGSEVLDAVWGTQDMPGILPGSVNLLTGVPGAGKTTLLIQLIEALAKAGHSVLYNIGEENPRMFRYTANRLGVVGNFPISVFKDADKLCAYCKENRVEVLVQDSLQSLNVAGIDNRKTAEVKAAQRLIELGRTCGTTVLLVGQITKGGVFSGAQQIQHDVDVHGHMTLDRRTGNRLFQMHKNRFGVAMVPYEMQMSANGISMTPAGDAPSGTGTGRVAQRREATLEVIKRLMLEGKRVSGYSHETEPDLMELNIQGGFMRAMLRLACGELSAEGHVIKSEVINRREQWYVEI